MCADITCGTERLAVQCINEIDDEPHPGDFAYIAHSGVQLQLSSADGCCCTGGCSAATGCSCAAHGQLECGSACQCAAECGRRASQQGLSVPVQLCKGRKGWGVYAAQHISKGKFVASYVGEHLNSHEADRRLLEYDLLHGSRHALLVIKENLPSGACLRLNIDATRRGNVSRFLNHSCDGGNLAVDVVRSCGDLMPRVAFFAARDIASGDELIFSYGMPSAGAAGGPDEPAQRCFCNTASCLGRLPRGGR